MDENKSVPNFDGVVILWKSYFEDIESNIYSIPNLVEENSDRYRREYLSLVYEVGESRIKNRRLIDWFEIRPEFSFRWMSLVVENSYGKS
ncbi:hypothetical protein [Leptospira noguchii]|uniref:hypothetical protein n=1 Tax=Leptospira noguchii TaxID=28182 RepID=UPI00114706DC|nr:hypothetical protein [Leptospira noguchii]TQE83110.1 hypothetical protein FF021_02360 [Leptospira noguchii]UOG54028.1 hypothetical protein MAL09_08035 [Leptospira noguchii]